MVYSNEKPFFPLLFHILNIVGGRCNLGPMVQPLYKKFYPSMRVSGFITRSPDYIRREFLPGGLAKSPACELIVLALAGVI